MAIYDTRILQKSKDNLRRRNTLYLHLEGGVSEDKRNKVSRIFKSTIEWGSKIARYLTYVPGNVDYFFSFLNIITDFNELKKANLEFSELKDVLDIAEKGAIQKYGKVDPQMQEVIAAVKFAMHQKNRKWWRRLVSFISALATKLFSALVLGQDPAGTLVEQAITKLGLSPDLMIKGYHEAKRPNTAPEPMAPA